MKTKIILSIAGLIILAGIIFSFVYFIPKIHLPKKVLQSAIESPGYYAVEYVVDGDTIAVNMDGHEEKVRLIGLDTPETKKPNSPVECYGQEASAYAHKIMDNQSVRLAADPINTNRDRYDRLLRYVYLKTGALVNSEMIRLGYGFAYLSFPFTKSAEFATIQGQAKESKVGVWAGTCQIRNDNGRFKTNELTHLANHFWFA
jgi:micrococcal nuclease